MSEAPEAPRGTTDVPTAAARLGIHKLTAYEAIRRGEFPLPVIKIGRRYVIPTAALERLLAGESER